MTAAELFAAYPNVKHAVAYVELIICEPVDGESAWDLLMTTLRPMSPKDVADCLCDDGVDVIGRTERECMIRAEMDHPEFLRYLAGKMGAV